MLPGQRCHGIGFQQSRRQLSDSCGFLQSSERTGNLPMTTVFAGSTLLLVTVLRMLFCYLMAVTLGTNDVLSWNIRSKVIGELVPVAGRANADESHPDYVPSVNMGYATASGSVERYSRKLRRKVVDDQRCELLNPSDDDQHETGAVMMEDDRSAAASALVALSTSASIADQPDMYTTASYATYSREYNFDSLFEQYNSLRLENEKLRAENIKLLSEKCLQEEVNRKQFRCHNPQFNASSIENDDKKTTFYTGLPNHATFLWVVTHCSDELPSSRLLSPHDIVLLVLMKLQLNLVNQDLAYRFGISKALVSQLVALSLGVLANQLKFLIHWPDKESCRRTLPGVFKPLYKDCRVIIDCTEIFIERPGNLTARASTYSNYKHHNTLKYLIGITPTGSVSFMSKAYGGRTSDKVVTQRSGLLDLLEYGDLVLADRGFLVEEDITARNCRLKIPAFTRGKAQLSQKDVETSRQLARVRIHVERAIGRLRHFQILNSSMTISLVPHADNILIICAAISNLHPKLVS